MAQTAEQLSGSGTEELRRASMRRLRELDWDFPTQASESPYSALHWHPCRFPSQIPAISIARLSEKSDVILDPFMGSATSIVEAQRLGRKSVGIDVNPISVMIGKAKTLPVSSEAVAEHVNARRLLVRSKWDELTVAEVPQSVQLTKWYTEKTALSLRKLWGILQASPEPLRLIDEAAFSSILLAACRETRHWGYVCDNSEPKSDRENDVPALFCSALSRFGEAYRQRDSYTEGATAQADIMLGAAQNVLCGFPDNHFSCVVTSPPYFGVADYVKAQRLSMEWWSQDIEPIRKTEIGARSKRHRKTSLEEYISELRAVFTETHRVMKPAGIAVIVFGQSPARRESHDRFVEALKEVGFFVELERTRQIPKMRRQKPSLLEEIVIIARK